MDIVQKAKEIHDEIRTKLKNNGLNPADIEVKIKDMDVQIYETVVEEYINGLDDSTYKIFEKLVDKNASDEEIASVIDIDDPLLQQRVIEKLEEYSDNIGKYIN
jgi:ATP-dependent protease HslVU (ClpYQ) ATPase subunit